MPEKYIVENGKTSLEAEFTREENLYCISVNGKTYNVNAVEVEKDIYSLLIEGEAFEVAVKNNHTECHVYLPGVKHTLKIYDEKKVLQKSSAGKKTTTASGRIVAPMPGKIVKILVKEGEQVEEGTGLIVIEAMKMENELRSPSAGIVSKILVKEGTAVEGNEGLIEII